MTTRPDGFPIQLQRGAAAHPLRIPWSLAELAYSAYYARYGGSQTLERLAERGGFAPSEMDLLLPDWRRRCCCFELLAELVHQDGNGLPCAADRTVPAPRAGCSCWSCDWVTRALEVLS